MRDTPKTSVIKGLDFVASYLPFTPLAFCAVVFHSRAEKIQEAEPATGSEMMSLDELPKENYKGESLGLHKDLLPPEYSPRRLQVWRK